MSSCNRGRGPSSKLQSLSVRIGAVTAPFCVDEVLLKLLVVRLSRGTAIDKIHATQRCGGEEVLVILLNFPPSTIHKPGRAAFLSAQPRKVTLKISGATNVIEHLEKSAHLKDPCGSTHPQSQLQYSLLPQRPKQLIVI